MTDAAKPAAGGDFAFLEEWRVTAPGPLNGQSLAELSRRRPVLAICLRHGGCPFCRQTLAELAARKKELETAGIVAVLVHLMTDDDARELFARYSLDDHPRIADPQGRLFDALGLSRGSLWQVAGPAAWWHGTKAVLGGHLPGRPRGDVFRLPGAFLIRDGKVERRLTESGVSHAQPEYSELLDAESRGVPGR